MRIVSLRLFWLGGGMIPRARAAGRVSCRMGMRGHDGVVPRRNNEGGGPRVSTHESGRDDDGTIAPLRARGMVVDTPTAAQRAQWQAVFTRTRARLVGTLADAAYFQRVERARQ